MKYLSKCILFSFILLCLTAFMVSDQFGFAIKIKNIENKEIRKAGILPTELNEMTVTSNDISIKIEQLEITLARGNRAVKITETKGNTFNLRKFSEVIRSGDRFVIEVKTLKSQSENENPQNAIITIPVN